MNKKDTEALRVLLVKERDRLKDELADIESSNHEQLESGSSGESLYHTHMADTATETFDRERDLTLEGNVRDLLGRVNLALEKIEAGTYGTCVVCGKQIDSERLKALSYADMCIECKRKEEAW